MYASRAAFSQHEALDHPLMVPDPNKNVDPKCVFCNEDLGFDRPKRVRHIGRHMEEIAFAIVTKPYEKWDFYSMSSEMYLDGQGPWNSEPTWYPCICYDCGVEIHTVAEREKHFVSVHGLSVAAARAQSSGGYQCRCSNSLEQPPCNTAKQSTLTAGLKRPRNNKKQLFFKDDVESRRRLIKPVKDGWVFESSKEEEEDIEDDIIEEDSEEDSEEDDDTSEWEDYIFEAPDDPKEPLYRPTYDTLKIIRHEQIS